MDARLARAEGVSRRIKRATKGTFQVQPASCSPALHRLEEAGRLKSSRGESASNRRTKYYWTTKPGSARLKPKLKTGGGSQSRSRVPLMRP